MVAEPSDARSRRRGRDLELAIYQAALDECLAVGYGRLSMERIAMRARTGKAALYRRWESKQDLLLAALENLLFDAADERATGSLRGDLLARLRRMADVLGGRRGQPGAVLLLGELLRYPELIAVVRAKLIEPRLHWVLDAMRHAASRGEIPAAAVTPLLARVGPAMVIQHYLLFGAVPENDELAAIVDGVILPALRGTEPRRKP